MTAKILFVDDEPDLAELVRQKFKRKLRKGEYEIFFAANGIDALEKVQAINDLDLVISDINMSEMDGLTLLGKLAELDPIFKTIIVSADGNLGNIRKAMNLGAFDFLLKPVNFSDLEITIQKTLQHVQQIKQNQQQLHQAQEQLTAQEQKMALLGNLLAGVAHDINNPLTFVSANLEHTETYIKDILHHLQLYQQQCADSVPELQEHAEEIDLPFMMVDLPKLVTSMQVGTKRIRDISNSLRTFSRADDIAKEPFDIHEGIDSTLTILKHRLKANELRPEIQVVKQYDQLPLVKCYPSQLNQVFMNIIANAIDAMEEANQDLSLAEIEKNPNIISIRTEKLPEGWVAIHLADNGAGIKPEICKKLFDSFFTTKPMGKGTGLGLSISYKIITEKHQGKLYCSSQLGQGAEFSIELPIHSK